MQKRIVIVCAAILVLFLIAKGSVIFSGGRDVYAERYEFEIGELDLIKKIETYQDNNAQYKVPNDVQETFGGNGRDTVMGDYDLSFYYPDENKIFFLYVTR